MADRFLLFDYATRQVVAELPVIDSFAYTETLNKPGSWDATIHHMPPGGTHGIVGYGGDDLYSSRAAFGFERAGVLRWVGPILTVKADMASHTIDLSGEGFMSYLRRRVIHTTHTYAQVDQMAIAKDLIDYTQGLESGNLGINTVPLGAMTTVARDRTYHHYEKKLVGEAIEQLAEVRDGFDFRLVPQWENGPNSRYYLAFEVIYPATGRDTGFTFDVNSQDITTIEVDLTRLAYRVVVVGQGTGEDIPTATLERSNLIAVNALLEDVVSAGDIQEEETLEAHAQRRLDVGSTPLIYPNLVLKTTDPATSFLGAFVPGDRVNVVGGTGVLDIGGVYRIAEQTFGLQADGPETLELTLAPLAAWLEDTNG